MSSDASGSEPPDTSEVTRAELEAMDHGQLVSFVIEQTRRIEELERRVNADFEGAAMQRQELRDEISDLEDKLSQQITQEVGRQQRERAKIRRRLSNAEDELGIEDEDILALAEGGDDAVRESELSRLLEAGPQAIRKRPSAVYYRAEDLARNWIRWGESRTKSGDVVERTLASKRDELKMRLEDARDENLGWSQVYRAMEKVDELGPSNIFLTEREQGKMLVQRLDGGDD